MSLGRLIAFERLSVTSDLPVPRKQPADLLQRLLILTSRVRTDPGITCTRNISFYAGRNRLTLACACPLISGVAFSTGGCPTATA